VRLIGLLHLVVAALSVALSAITVGAVLSTALLIGPAAIGSCWPARSASARRGAENWLPMTATNGPAGTAGL
jgi:hypothetical protein